MPAADVATPDNVAAKSLKSYFTFIPTFALVSVNIVLSLSASACPSSVPTCLFSAKSILLPTITIVTSSPLMFLAYSTHEVTFSKLCFDVIS